MNKPVIVEAEMLTPFGHGAATCFSALLKNRTAVGTVQRFATTEFNSHIAATIAGLEYHGAESLVMQMLTRLFAVAAPSIPADASLLLATTKGEIDFLEKSLLGMGGEPGDSRLGQLLPKVALLSGAGGPAAVISSACTSSLSAVARGAALIRGGDADAVLVVAGDSVTEFIYAGFSSLMALDVRPARPFDADRKGLSLGEAAAFTLLMSSERADREKRAVLAEIVGWGMGDDANHMTGPSRESSGLISALHKTLATAGRAAPEIDFISAHGTGTSYNDEMEMRAFRAVFGETPRPVYSVKGATGHTMGAAGLVELIVALQALRAAMVPPTVNLQQPDAAARGWVAATAVPLQRPERALVTNSGFSGVNAAIILQLPTVNN